MSQKHVVGVETVEGGSVIHFSCGQSITLNTPTAVMDVWSEFAIPPAQRLCSCCEGTFRPDPGESLLCIDRRTRCYVCKDCFRRTAFCLAAKSGFTRKRKREEGDPDPRGMPIAVGDSVLRLQPPDDPSRDDLCRIEWPGAASGTVVPRQQLQFLADAISQYLLDHPPRTATAPAGI